MIYILINNEYHVYDYKQWIDELKDHRVSLIQIPHSLKPLKSSPYFESIYVYSRFFNGLFSLFHFWRIFKVHWQIKSQLRPQKDDVLFMYTEYEILNQFIAELFYKEGSRIYLLEDGLATMTISNSKSLNVNLKTKLYTYILKYIYSYKYLKIFNLPDPTPLMDDKIFNGICVRLGTEISRNIPLYRVSYKLKSLSGLNSDRAVFVNNDLYNFFCSFEEFIAMIKRTLDVLSQSFKEVYFKFHPRETSRYIQLIKQEVGYIPNITFLEQNFIIEDQMFSIKPKFAFSYVSAGLINLYHLGIVPVFLYETEEKMRNDIFIQDIKSFLESVNYVPIRSLSDFRKSYSSGLVSSSKNILCLSDIVNLKLC